VKSGREPALGRSLNASIEIGAAPLRSRTLGGSAIGLVPADPQAVLDGPQGLGRAGPCGEDPLRQLHQDAALTQLSGEAQRVASSRR